MSVLTDTERRTEAVKAGADEKFDDDGHSAGCPQSYKPFCLDKTC
jgi:hypothetical protein